MIYILFKRVTITSTIPSATTAQSIPAKKNTIKNNNIGPIVPNKNPIPLSIVSRLF